MVRLRHGGADAARLQPLWSRIPFSEAGDYVYHCHIGEHQDSGMMAHIRVIAFR